MGIGVGIVLIVLGLILVMGVVNLPSDVTQYVEAHTLGWIFLIVGVIAIILALIMNAQRQRTTRVERRE